ncbi:MAG: CPBP family glutamic-type intramembrane protease [Gemmataceae bacterium]|nr:CPBP family glutamic-type intramembrane protease [Gemmataceae bacterium]MDW8263972.1 CPBP family glutamic-type intramembrane protease [Gemmataceae bacterium]
MPGVFGYLAATRHPLPCLLFLLPLLVGYEAGVLWLGGTDPDAVRNGADTWLRWGLESFGLAQLYGLPVLVTLLFLTWSWWRWWERPDDLPGVLAGMALESILFALGLCGLSRTLGPMLDRLGVALQTSTWPEGLRHAVTYLGAGIYEELLFRMLLFGGLLALLQILGAPWLAAAALAAAASSLLFAAAHHAGPYGEPFERCVFLFRTLAGLYFVVIYQLRGFGIAVGAHACYDVLVDSFTSG